MLMVKKSPHWTPPPLDPPLICDVDLAICSYIFMVRYGPHTSVTVLALSVTVLAFILRLSVTVF